MRKPASAIASITQGRCTPGLFQKQKLRTRPHNVVPAILIFYVLLTLGPIGSALGGSSLVTIETVTVGDAGNAADPLTGYGTVDHDYRIGKYELTIAQYTAFLNAVARTDTNSYIVDLWNAFMTSNLNSAGISRTGGGTQASPYIYSPIGDSNRPIAYVSWFNAARFANWLHNGATYASSTEVGAYTLNGAFGMQVAAPARNSGAKWYIPTENEWYKAAHYKGGGTNAGYWMFPTQADSVPDNLIGAASPNQANWISGNDALYAVTRSGAYDSSTNYLTPAGAFFTSPGPYGTFDQGGNVSEWTDLSGETGIMRVYRGGSWRSMRPDFGSCDMDATTRTQDSPANIASTLGFRLASVEYPASTNAALSGLALSSGTLTPTFSMATTSYTASVLHGVASMTVTPTSADGFATITVNGTPVVSGGASGPFSLSVGTNMLAIVVTAENGIDTETYTVSVVRQGPTMPVDPLVGTATFIGGQANVTMSAVTGLYYYLVYPSVPLPQISANPINLAQWSVAASEAPATNSPVTLQDASAAAQTGRVYGVLIRTDAIP